MNTLWHHIETEVLGKRAATLFFNTIQKTYGNNIHPRATIWIGLNIPRPNGIVIDAGTVIGDNVTIFRQVTLGGARMGGMQKNLFPGVGIGIPARCNSKQRLESAKESE